MEKLTIKEIQLGRISLVFVFVFLATNTHAQKSLDDSLKYYRNVFALDSNICNGTKKKAYNYLSNRINLGSKRQSLLKNLKGNYHYKVLEGEEKEQFEERYSISADFYIEYCVWATCFANYEISPSTALNYRFVFYKRQLVKIITVEYG